jgi:phospholipid-translocating ATPase
VGNLTIQNQEGPCSDVVPISVDNVLWANTVLAAGSAVGLVVYTGKDSRAVMNTSEPETKVGLLDLEINRMAKVRSQPCRIPGDWI